MEDKMYAGPWGLVRKIWMEDREAQVSIPKWIIHILLDSLDKEFILNILLDEKKIETTASTMNECLGQIIERLEVLGKYNSASKNIKYSYLCSDSINQHLFDWKR